MPYIADQKDRMILDGHVTNLAQAIHYTSSPMGSLNYAITRLVPETFLRMRSRMNYDMLVDMIGTLEMVKLEMYRRMAAPYEDKKIEENGDVYAKV